ncbi:hypothetical protein, partial [Thermogutta sp.]|uniref:hypothetical protein n=1 Tax=Thermogutta sp. TaxID=1962930 RepID=UPI0025D9A527
MQTARPSQVGHAPIYPISAATAEIARARCVVGAVPELPLPPEWRGTLVVPDEREWMIKRR